MKTKILTLLAASCLGFFSACSSDDSEGSKSLTERCETLSEDCLIGKWTLKEIVQKSDQQNIQDFSNAQGGVLEFKDDGIYHYERSSISNCPGSLGGAVDDEGHWSIDEEAGTLVFKVDKQGDCMGDIGRTVYTTTPKVEITGETSVSLSLNTVIFQQDENAAGDNTEVFTRTE